MDRGERVCHHWAPIFNVPSGASGGPSQIPQEPTEGHETYTVSLEENDMTVVANLPNLPEEDVLFVFGDVMRLGDVTS